VPPSQKSPLRLCVEGSDDKFVVIELVAKLLGKDWDRDAATLPYLDDKAGIAALLDRATLSAAAKTYTHLGLVLDADEDVLRQWERLRRVLPEGIALPEQPDPAGTIVPGLRANTRFGVWVMPDNSRPGALEHLLQTLIVPDDPLWMHAGKATEEAVDRGAEFPSKARDKAALRAWLAWQAEPGVPPGRALRSGYFRGASPEVRAFVAWFERLFLTA